MLENIFQVFSPFLMTIMMAIIRKISEFRMIEAFIKMNFSGLWSGRVEKRWRFENQWLLKFNDLGYF
jgi:hypothetical protein